MTVMETERLLLREFVAEDAAFILELVNEPDWLRFIGDRGIHDLDAARRYIVEGPRAMQARAGFSLWCVEARAGGEPLGMCGLIKRDTLEHVDIGFAFLARHRGRGYAREAAAATLAHARMLGLGRLAAITNPENIRSIRLLEALGFQAAGQRQLTPQSPAVSLFLQAG
ncbi:MAG TPA: GNAT family N-acetyltransferase [Gammaproteobacteria bacterium]|jgi:RimJ/RimL family protein N-acetyltransferase